ncbi:hypothetical protein OAI07_00365 [Akkermansiaceae bacterium]|nr:hypothetical protein [Akkermansiaceae bacterium]
MNKSSLTSLFALCLIPIFLSSCSTRLSQTEKTSIKAVSILKPAISPLSYTSPHGGSAIPKKILSETGNLVGLGTDGVLGFFVGDAAGSLVGASVSYIQNAMFRHQNKEHFAMLQNGIPTNLSTKLDQEIIKQIRANSFFSDKIKRESTHHFHTEITKIGLKRIGKKEGIILLSPIIVGNLTLIGDTGQLIDIKVIGTASSMAGRTIDEYRAQPSLLNDDYLLAIEEFGRDLKAQINRETR